MAIVDEIFKENLKEILKQEWEIDNRAKWKDGTPVKTKRIFGVVNKYDLSKEFPILTLRKHNIKSLFKEISWIYQKKSNNVNDLGLNIWDSWTNEDGSIGKGYGYQINKPTFAYESQIDFILNEIKRNPTSRRLVIEMWNVDDLNEMNLTPCVHHVQFGVKNGKLNAIVKQRSNDFLVANNWNVASYALFIHMVARHTGLEVGEMIHVVGDMHIYNKHEEQAYELLNREPLPAPKLWVNPDVRDFYEFTEDDFKLIDYKHREPQLKFEVAI